MAHEWGVDLLPAVVNGGPGFRSFDAGDRLVNVVGLDVEDGVITRVHSMLNPDKLGHLGPLSDNRAQARAASGWRLMSRYTWELSTLCSGSPEGPPTGASWANRPTSPPSPYGASTPSSTAARSARGTATSSAAAAGTSRAWAAGSSPRGTEDEGARATWTGS